MNLNIHHCRLCLQKTQEPAKTLSKDSKIFALVTNLFPGMDTSLVINSKLCCECFKSVQFSNLVIESVRRNEQKILLKFQNILEKSTCRLCLSNEKLEAALCLVKNTNEEAKHITEMAIVDLDFDKFRKPDMCNSCWQKVKFISLFKKKCFATEKILKYYCASNKINSLDRKELEIISLSFREKLQHFSENLDKQTFVFDRNAGSSYNLNVNKNYMNPPDMGDLNNFPKNEHDFFEEVPNVVNILNAESDVPKEEYEIDIVEEKLNKITESDENEDMAVDTVSLESLDNIQNTEITSNDSKVLIKKNVESNNYHLTKSPSLRSSDMEKKIQSPDVLEKPQKKRKIKTRLSVKEEEDLFYDECDFLPNSSTCQSSTTRSDIRDHDSENKTTLSFNCEKGLYETREEVDIELHLKAHQTEKNILQCSKCYYITACSNSLKNHLETHKTRPKIFKCQESDYMTEKHSSLVTHMSIHQDNYNFKCPKCSYRCKYKALLAKHMVIHQENYDFSCDRCNYQAKRKDLLIRHMVTHQENYNFSCDRCNHQAKRKDLLIRHMITHQENYNFSCDKCNYQAKRKGDLTRHMVIHQHEYNFKCPKCGYQAKSKQYLIAHMVVHQENYKFSCDNCNYQAKRKYEMVTHMLSHQEKYKFSCFKCNYQTNKKHRLVSHMLIHQENYNFSCDKCNYQAKRKYELIRHMVTHQDQYNFKCSKCSYRGKCKAHLAKHMVIRQENYEFSCDKCNYQAKRKVHLARHMVIHQD